MAERTDERTLESEDESVDLDGEAGGDVDLDGLVDDPGETAVGFDDDELGVDVDALTGESGGSPTAPEPDDRSRSQSRRGNLRSRLGPSVSVPSPLSLLPSPLAAVPSVRSLGVSFGVVVASLLLFGAALPLGDVGSVLGIAAGAFVLGVASGRRRYLALVASGAVAAAVSVVLGQLFLSAVANLAVPLAAVGAGGGAAAAFLGHYLGRDLRDGLTRQVD